MNVWLITMTVGAVLGVAWFLYHLLWKGRVVKMSFGKSRAQLFSDQEKKNSNKIFPLLLILFLVGSVNSGCKIEGPKGFVYLIYKRNPYNGKVLSCWKTKYVPTIGDHIIFHDNDGNLVQAVGEFTSQSVNMNNYSTLKKRLGISLVCVGE